jgi:hypothetical protein
VRGCLLRSLLLCGSGDRVALRTHLKRRAARRAKAAVVLSFLRFWNGSAGDRGCKPQLGKVHTQKSPLTQIKRQARKADQSARTFLRFVAVVAAFVAGIVYWNFGTLSPCGLLREAIRQRGDLVAIFPDGVIDFGFEAQFGKMSAKRCLAVLVETLTSPLPSTGQASQLSMQPLVSRQGKQRSSPSVPRLPPFAP